MGINIISNIDACRNHILYVLGFLNEHPLLPQGNHFALNDPNAKLDIIYGEADSGDYCIPAQELIFTDKVISNSDLFCNEFSSNSRNIYSLESVKKAPGPFLKHKTFGFDIIETIFFHISRYEEYHCSPSNRDKWDMMWEKQHILVREDLYHIPVIDHLVFSFFDSIGLHPIKHKTTYSLSHDIDVIQKFKNPYRIFRSSIRALLDNGVSGFLNHLNHVVAVKRNTQKDPYDTFEFLLIDSSTNQFKQKVLYLMAGGLTDKDNHYQINDDKITSVIAKAQQLGYEIGLHGSYATHHNGKQHETEMAHLAKASGKAIRSNRQHFLHFDFHHTPQILENSGIQIDSSLGYQRLVGFRCGTGYPYRLFDFITKRGYSWKELPMIIMDGALLNEAGDRMDKAEELLDRILAINQSNTHITLNVHNTIFDPSKRNAEQMKALYTKMIAVAK